MLSMIRLVPCKNDSSHQMPTDEGKATGVSPMTACLVHVQPIRSLAVANVETDNG
jgi:hypothetical protein